MSLARLVPTSPLDFAVNRLPLRVVAALLVTAVVAACAPAVRPTVQAPLTADQLAELWVAPDDIAGRDVVHGPGGRALVPSPDARYTVKEADTTGFSRGYDVVDGQGREWKVKLGEEAQPEFVVSRVLWAIGYHQPAMYYVTSLDLDGGDPAHQGMPARLRAEFGYDSEGDWSWHENPFVGTPQLRGLLVANLIMNNWDLKPSQNRIYEMEDGRRPVRRYVVQDLGASLGMTAWPTGNRNDIESFEQQRLIKAVTTRGIEFDYGARHRELFEDITPEDVVWVCRLLAQLTDAQWRDVFAAAHYPPDLSARFIKKLKSKIQEGLDLANREGATR